MRGMMNAQANDSGWPTFSGKYVEYPRFRKEWWAYRQTYHGHVCNELVCHSLKEGSLASHVRLLELRGSKVAGRPQHSGGTPST
jgi:hypothetical protein